MKIVDQVVSVEPAEELRELGVKQDSVWFWSRCAILSSTEYGQGVMKLMLAGYKSLPDRIEHYSAYTVAELGEMLPENYITYNFYNNVTPTILRWCCRSHESDMPFECAKKEADARAKMLIFLIKEGITEK